VNSVLDQSFRDWELVISDDERVPGDTWRVIQEFSTSEKRIRGVQNKGCHGQVGNSNNAIRAAEGTWIKILHDDDVLKPNCLEVLARIITEHGDVVAVSCAFEGWVGGEMRVPFRRADRPLLEKLAPDSGLLAMYILDEASWSIPTSQLVRRSIIDAGVVFEQPEGLFVLVDSWWNARVLAHGPILVYNEPLVEWHQGVQDTITSSIEFDKLTEEMVLLRRLIFPLVPARMSPPSLPTAEKMIRLIRALAQVRRQPLAATGSLFGGIAAPKASWLALAWVLRRWAPRHFSKTRRTVVWE
jgi:hypothetical protein